jgi:hypothetical protein
VLRFTSWASWRPCRSVFPLSCVIPTRAEICTKPALRTRIEHITLLAADEPTVAREQVGEAIRKWPGVEFQTPHWWSLVSESETLLYSGQASLAANLWAGHWKRMRRSQILRLQYILLETLHQRAAAALGVAAAHDVSNQECHRCLKLAESDAARMEREDMPWGNALATLLRAGAAAARRRKEDAAALLISSEEAFRKVDMELFAAVARRRRGETLGGNEGRALVHSADTWMAGQNIQRPERMAAMLAPGSW